MRENKTENGKAALDHPTQRALDAEAFLMVLFSSGCLARSALLAFHESRVTAKQHVPCSRNRNRTFSEWAL